MTESDEGKTNKATASDDKSKGNSEKNAKDDLPYVRVAMPTTIEGIVKSLNTWAYYVEAWGAKVANAVENPSQAIEGGEATKAAGPTHLDPPPPPWSNSLT